jgi:hypothetical protein
VDLRVDDAAMKALVAKSIVDSLTPETREKLITEAVRMTLATPEGSGYGSKRSPLQQAFDWAVAEQARKYANEVIAEDTNFKEQLRKLFEDVSRKIFENEQREQMVTNIANVIVGALTKDRY